jgi:hypothetical protein
MANPVKAVTVVQTGREVSGIISPMPEDQLSEKTIRHRLAAWVAHQLPEGHRLL